MNREKAQEEKQKEKIKNERNFVKKSYRKAKNQGKGILTEKEKHDTIGKTAKAG